MHRGYDVLTENGQVMPVHMIAGPQTRPVLS